MWNFFNHKVVTKRKKSIFLEDKAGHVSEYTYTIYRSKQNIFFLYENLVPDANQLS